MTGSKGHRRRLEKENSIPSFMIAGVAICAGLFIAWLVADPHAASSNNTSGRRDYPVPIPLMQQVAPLKENSKHFLSSMSEPASAQLPNELVAGDFYRFADRDGVIHLVNDPAKIPPEYRKQVIVTTGASGETPVLVTPQGHVLVPVTLYYRGRSVKTRLMLDTGASTTIISEETAAELGIRPEETYARTSHLADGRRVLSHEVEIDSIRVGPKEVRQTPVAILPSAGRREHQSGLLGMSFLKSYRYQVDLAGQKIVWR
jgi:clan AA aspartic protease (TIGR02281 family)